MSCLICERIQMIKNGQNPYFVRELNTGYVVIGDHQHFKGYTLFLCKMHCIELHELDEDFKLEFLKEMSITAQAVYNAFKPDKLNYELLGNGDTHLHWHIFPRVDGDLPQKGPVWLMPIQEMFSEKYRPSKTLLNEMVLLLQSELKKLV